MRFLFKAQTSVNERKARKLELELELELDTSAKMEQA